MFPPEVLRQIFQEIGVPTHARLSGNLDDPHPHTEVPAEDALSSLARVCRCSHTFHELATPLLYQCLSVEMNEPWHSQLLMTLTSRPGLGRFVLELRVSLKRKEDDVIDPAILAEAVENLLKTTINLVQVEFLGVNTADPQLPGSSSEAASVAMWTKAFGRLAGTVKFELPPLPNLHRLKVNNLYQFPSLLSSFFPALTTFTSMIPSKSWEANKLDVFGNLISQLHYLDFFSPATPQIVYTVLTMATNLKRFKCSLVLGGRSEDSRLFSDLPPSQEFTALPSLDKLEVTIQLLPRMPGQPLANEFVESVRKLVFDYRTSKVVEIKMARFEVPWDNAEDVLPRVRSEWRREGTTVDVQLKSLGRLD